MGHVFPCTARAACSFEEIYGACVVSLGAVDRVCQGLLAMRSGCEIVFPTACDTGSRRRVEEVHLRLQLIVVDRRVAFFSVGNWFCFYRCFQPFIFLLSTVLVLSF